MRIFFLAITLLLAHSVSSAVQLTAKDFAGDPNIMDLAISPNGRYLASLWSENGQRSVLIQDLNKGGEAIGSVSGSAHRPFSVRWASNERLLVGVAIPTAPKKVEEKLKEGTPVDWRKVTQAYRFIAMDPDGSNRSVLLAHTGTDANKYEPKIQHLLPDDKDHIMVMANFRGRQVLIKANLHDGKGTRISRGEWNTFSFSVADNGEVRYRYDYNRPSRTIDVYEQKEGLFQWKKTNRIKFRRNGEASERIEEYFGIWGDGKLAYRDLNEETGYFEIHVREGEDSKVLVSRPDKDIEGLIRSPSSNNVIGYWIEEKNVFRAIYFDEKHQEKYDLIRNKVSSVGFSGFALHRSEHVSPYTVVRTSGQDDPGTFLLYDSNKNNLQLFGFSRSKINPDTLSIPAVVKYNARDGLSIEAFLLFPQDYEGGKKYSAIMLPHGGPHARDYAYYDGLAQFLSTRGYFVLQPNFRGSRGYGRKFEEMGHKQLGGTMQDDLDDGIDYLVKKGYVNPDKVCIVGASYGGYAALMGAMSSRKLYQCAISINGVTDLLSMLSSDRRKFKRYPQLYNEMKQRIGDPRKDKKLLKKISPVRNAKNINVPVMIVSGVEDERVPFSQQEKIVSALKKYKKEYSLIKLRYAGHNVFDNELDAEEVLSKIEIFLSKYLH